MRPFEHPSIESPDKLEVRRGALILGVLVLSVTGLTFWSGRTGGFMLDDINTIVRNPDIWLTHPLLPDWWRAMFSFGMGGRPLAMLSFALSGMVAGPDPAVFNVHNLFLHLVNSVLVYVLCLQVFAFARTGGTDSSAVAPWAAGAALLWAANPMQVSTVFYIVQRMEIIATTFVLASLVSYCAGRKRQLAGTRAWPWLVAACGLAALGVAAKETAVFAVLYTAMLEIALLKVRAAQRQSRNTLLSTYAIAAVVATLATAVWLPPFLSPIAYADRDYTWAEKTLSQFRILPGYVGSWLLPLPSRLPFYYDMLVPSRGWIDPWTTVMGFGTIAATVGVSWHFRRLVPLAFLGVGWFLAAHVATSFVLPVELAFEHRNYFASIGLALVVVDAMRVTWHQAPRARRVLAFGALAVLAACMGLATIRASIWGKPLLRAATLSHDNRASGQASYDYARELLSAAGSGPDQTLFAAAVAQFERAAYAKNASALPESTLIILASRTGNVPPPRQWQSLQSKLERQPYGADNQSAMLALMHEARTPGAIERQPLQKALEVMLARRPYRPWRELQYADFAWSAWGDVALLRKHLVRATELEGTQAAYDTQEARMQSAGRADVVRALRQSRIDHLGPIRIGGSDE